MSYLEIKENFCKQEGSLMPKYRQRATFPVLSYLTQNFDLGKNNRIISIYEVLAAEIDIRVVGNVLHGKIHRYAEVKDRAQT